MAATETRDDRLLARALTAATDTKALELGDGALARAAGVLQGCFGDRPAALVADANTWEAAGRRPAELLRARGVSLVEPIVLDAADLHAEYAHVDRLRAAFAAHEAAPVAVGSGTINDLVKLASHECGRAYMVVATAASMDGYAAYGASITRDGLKQTFPCPAPRAVIADMDVLCRAPVELNSAGYGDLAAKSTSGADWLVASALGVEPVVEPAWSLVQDQLRQWLAQPDAIRRGDRDAVRNLLLGLLISGFAMQSARSSRAASGSEPQFSHLWDMQNHTHQGRTPYHGCKVAIGTLVVTLLYEHLLPQQLDRLPIDDVCRAWPSLAERLRQIEGTHRLEYLKRTASIEGEAKYVDRDGLAARLRRLQGCWGELREQLRRQLIPSARLIELFDQAGVPSTPAAIGITLPRLRQSLIEAQQIRRRYTVLDLALETGLLESGADAICKLAVSARCGPCP